jgi:hypothetical protein
LNTPKIWIRPYPIKAVAKEYLTTYATGKFRRWQQQLVLSVS